MTAILVDDEPHARQYLASLLEEYFPDLLIAGEAGDVGEAHEQIARHRPGLIFLDVQLGEATGFDLLEHYRDPAFQVIFVTCYDQYALRAIRFAALDYLIKPVMVHELSVAVQRARDRQSISGMRQQLTGLTELLKNNNKSQLRLALSAQGICHRVPLKDILYAMAKNGCTEFHMIDRQKYLVTRLLKYYAELLENDGFLKCHQSYLVNTDMVKTIHRDDGMLELELTDGTCIPVSRAFRDVVKQKMQAIKG